MDRGVAADDGQVAGQDGHRLLQPDLTELRFSGLYFISLQQEHPAQDFIGAAVKADLGPVFQGSGGGFQKGKADIQQPGGQHSVE